MSALRQFALIAAFLVVAALVSGVLYLRSQSADYDRHAQAIEAIGNARHLNRRLSELVLAARFGLLNQYDPLTSTVTDLSRARDELRSRIAAAIGGDAELDRALAAFGESLDRQRDTVEHFKAENSVLRNSIYYLPTAAREIEAKQSSSTPKAKPSVESDPQRAVVKLVQAALVYNLTGDQSSSATYQRALSELRPLAQSAPDELRPQVAAVLTHATVIAQKQPSVDGWVKLVIDNDAELRLREIEHAYHSRFGDTVSTSNRYRRILYGWSLFLALAVGAAGLQLRRMYADLERRVAARTADLQKALSALWGEMKLARKIQEALVPAAPELENCEVAVSMKPTDEVGGDYYDVIRVKGSEWVLIGDVSGHGVPAGLIMMMCHTAVRAVLRNTPDIMPDQLLAVVNSVLTENIRQLREDKYMTISALRRDPDGAITFAGAHQDICVYRADTDRVEAFETTGLWLGIRDQIADSLVPQRLKLGPGDVLLLFTDGITEATCEGIMFDMVGVRRVLDRASGKTAGEVLSDLLRELEGYELRDDATALVIRQLSQKTLRSVA
jgi:serine phosphatase RsbU (regulator of sigma subunit)